MASGAGHAGDLTPDEAIALLKSSPGAVLIDVRTAPEWDNVGVPDLTSLSQQPVFIAWLHPPAMTPNADFGAQLETVLTARGAGPQTPLLFLCRSGARSAAAAEWMTAKGYERSHNIAGGFEGAPAQGRAGWKSSGLPWTVG